jgi:ATP-binding cassette subfamily C protein
MTRTAAGISFLKVLNDIWNVLGYRYFVFVFLLTITGFVEGISLASVVPLLTAIGVGGSGIAAGQSFFADISIRFLSGMGMDPSVGSVSVFILVALATSSTLYLLQSYTGALLQAKYVNIWQSRLAASIFGANWQFFVNNRQGDLVNALVTEAPRLGGAFYQAGLMITGVVHGAIYLGIAARLSAVTTLIVLVGGVVLFGVCRPLIVRAYATGRGISDENAELQSISSEMVRSAKSLKVTGTEPEAVRLLQDVSRRLQAHMFRNSYDVQLAKGIFDFGAASVVAGVLYATKTLVHVEPAMTLVVLAIFVRLMPKLAGLQQSLQSISVTVPTVVRLHSLLAALSVAEELRDTRQLPDALCHGALGIEFEGVAVEYENLRIIDGVNFKIRPGECVCFVGASGAGKTTLVDALLGLVPISEGVVKINGVPLPELPITSLRRRVGYMGQDATIYNTTVRRNILWNHPDADNADYLAAMQNAAAKQFVDRMPSGCETRVGNGGAALSGGERQRLALARALLGNPGLIVLDEATSALDAETEAVVTAALKRQKGNVTIVLIAHRLASAKIADRICVLDNGALIEDGSWEELYALEKGAFRRLCDLQIGSSAKTESRAS